MYLFFLAYFDFFSGDLTNESVFNGDAAVLSVEAVAACAAAFAEISAEAEAEEERDLEFALRASGVENADKAGQHSSPPPPPPSTCPSPLRRFIPASK